MRQHLLRVEASATAFAPLIRALGAAAMRVGWLQLAPPEPGPADLEAAAGLGVLRAAAVGGGRSVAVKALHGAPVLRDLLQEHFRGCQLVLVQGPVDAPRLAAAGEGWTLTLPGGELELTTEALVAALRKPRPWGDADNDHPAAAGGG